ncbi:MAG: hypothetical protein M3Y56_09745 [Armatimonadota bacterium]|nr:hypothetical protein [Armatimonadota bacterium]
MTKTLRLAFALALALLVPFSMAAPSASARIHHSGNIFQRHRTASSLGAGYLAFHAARTTARNRRNSGQHLNFAQRHPYMTAGAVAIGTHHFLKHRSHRYSSH